MQTKVGRWIDRKYLDWQQAQGESKTINEFAEWLGISRGTLNKWINGDRTPTGKSLELLASKLGPDIYDILEQPRPDKRLKKVIENWGRLSEKAIAEIERILRENEAH